MTGMLGTVRVPDSAVIPARIYWHLYAGRPTFRCEAITGQTFDRCCRKATVGVRNAADPAGPGRARSVLVLCTQHAHRAGMP